MQSTLPQEKESRYQLLHRIGIALSAERNRDKLLDLILTEAQTLCNADGGTLYLVNDADELEFAIVKNESLQIDLGGISGHPVDFPALPLFDNLGQAIRQNVATYAAHEKRPIHTPDAYNAGKFDFSGTREFDRRSGYRSKSFLTIPLVNSEPRVIGILQLLNAQNDRGEVIDFDAAHQETVAALTSQAAIALDNKILMEAQKNFLESFIKMMASAIDAKSPYTGTHCERVPVITEMLIQEVCRAKTGPFANFSMSDDELYELHIAAWLHDCGKVTTPTHVMDKATKLETIHDRIQDIVTRFEVLKRDARIAYLEAVAAGGDKEFARKRYEKEVTSLDSDLAFLKRANVGGEYLPPDSQERVSKIGERVYEEQGRPKTLLSQEERANLRLSRGTLSPDERLIINGHMVQTARMLDALPFPRNLKRVPEYATGHHEKMNGEGYPRGVFAGDMSVPARAMAICDIFEALTADDRPYKMAKKLSEAMRIMGLMKQDNHLDPQLFDLFVSRRVYLRYATKHLDASLIDDVDEASLLAITPKEFTLPDPAIRSLRKEKLLEKYSTRFPLKESAASPLSIAPLSISPLSLTPPPRNPVSLRAPSLRPPHPPVKLSKKSK